MTYDGFVIIHRVFRHGFRITFAGPRFAFAHLTGQVLASLILVLAIIYHQWPSFTIINNHSLKIIHHHLVNHLTTGCCHHASQQRPVTAAVCGSHPRSSHWTRTAAQRAPRSSRSRRRTASAWDRRSSQVLRAHPGIPKETTQIPPRDTKGLLG